MDRLRNQLSSTSASRVKSLTASQHFDLGSLSLALRLFFFWTVPAICLTDQRLRLAWNKWCFGSVEISKEIASMDLLLPTSVKLWDELIRSEPNFAKLKARLKSRVRYAFNADAPFTLSVDRFFRPLKLYYLKKNAFDCFRSNLDKKTFADGRIFIVILKGKKIASVRNESVDKLTIPWSQNSDQLPADSARVLFSQTIGLPAETVDFIFPNFGIAPLRYCRGSLS